MPPDPIVFGPQQDEEPAIDYTWEVRGLITDKGPVLFESGPVRLAPGDTLTIRREGMYWFTFQQE
jgi:hypothetical protein